MNRFFQTRWLLPVVVFFAIAAGSVAVGAAPATNTTLAADCVASPTEVNIGEEVTLDGSGSSTSSLDFDFDGDGTYDLNNTENFVQTTSYFEGGQFYEPVVRDSDGQTDSCGSVYVNANPSPEFTYRPDPGIAGQPIEFDATNSTDSDGTIVEYHWDWNGDERIDESTTDPVLNHTFYQAGFKNVALTVEDDDGANETIFRDVEVVEPNVIARCSVEPTTAVVGQNVTIDARESENGTYLGYDPDGDGNYEVPETGDFRINWTYAEPGEYTPVITVYGINGKQNETTCSTVTVNPENAPPEPSFTWQPDPGIAGNPMEFDASASSDPDGNITTYYWDWNGDERIDETTTDPVVNETFFETGFRNVGLRVEDDAGVNSTLYQDVEVVPETVARCSVEPTSISPGDGVLIDATSTQNGSYLDYDFHGDGTYDRFETREFALEHIYEEPGTYTPTVRVYGPGGQRDVVECGTVTVNQPPGASFTYSPDPGIAGQSMTFDASNSADPDGTIQAYRWDWNSDGTFDETTNDPRTTHTYFQAGFENVRLQVVDERNSTGETTRDVEVVEPTIDARCTVEPTAIAPGGEVTIAVEHGGNASYLDYDFDGDGEFDRFETDQFTMTTSYDEAGAYTPVVRIYSDTGSRKIVECDTVTVEEPNVPPNATFVIDPSSPTVGKNATLDASNSTDSDGQIVTYSWDFDNDGDIDRNTTGPTVEHSYNKTGNATARLVVVDDDGAADEATLEFTVKKPKEGGLPPWWPIPAGAGLLGLGGLLYHHFGGGGAGGGDPKPKPKPRPHGTKGGGRYETGVFELPTSSGTLSVPVGFEPDLILFSAANGARTDTATDRTAGWTRGIAHRTAEGMENQCLTVADDAHSSDQATCAADAGSAVQIVRHEADGPLGRVTAQVTDTTSDGFDVDVSIPGDDPLAGGIRVLYQAFRTGSDVDMEVGTVMTPTEPGTQTVDLGIDADHVSLTTSAAVSDANQLWTTDRGVGVSVGHAVTEPESPVSQAVAGTSAWPGAGHPVAGVSDDAAALHLLYQDGDQLAGRTSASATAVGKTLRLQYDRVYNGPHKLGSTARHPISYLAMAGGDTMRPAVGTFSLPKSGETRTIDCGFQPAMIELQIAPAPLGEEVAAGATAHPFGWSQGTAISTDDRLRQYVLHHAVVPEQSAEQAASAASGPTGATQAQASTDGGRSPDVPEQAASDVPEMNSAASVPDLDVQPKDPQTPARSSADEETGRAPAAAEHEDDGRAGLWLATDPDGTIVGRDELRIVGITETGFQATVESVDTDRRGPAGDRPAVVYRAWPATDVTGTTTPEKGSADSAGQTDTSDASSGGSEPDATGANTGEGQR